MDGGSLSDTQRTMVLPLLQETNIRGRPYVTVSSKGIANGLSRYPNDGADFGPDTTLGATAPGQYGSPYTKTVGIQEAIVKANGTDTVYLIPGIFSPTASIQISISQTVIKSTTGFVFGGGMTPENAYIQCPANVDTFTISTQSFIIDGILFNGNNALSNTGDIAIHLYVGTEPLNGKILNCQFINNYIGIKNDTSEINPITGAAQSGQGYNLYYESNQYSCLYANKYFFNNNGSSHSIMEKFFNITSASGYGLFLQENVIHYLEGSLFVNPTAAALNVASNLFGAFTNYLINAYQNQSTPNPVLIAAGNLIFSACNIHNSTGGTTIINVINPPSTFNQSTYITDDKQTNEVTVNNTSTSGLFVITDPVYGKLNPPALTINPPVSGTAYQNTNPYDIRLKIPVTYNPTATAAATLATGISSTSTVTTTTKVSIPAGLTAADGQILTYDMVVPAGWYFELVATNATIGTVEVEAA